jgi:hypothetical protein
VRNGKVMVRGAPGAFGGGVPVGEIARRRLYQPGGGPILGVGEWDNPSEFPDESRYGNESGSYNFVAEAVEVEVDPETGEVKVLELAAAVDCGTELNPTLAEGQVEGAVARALRRRCVAKRSRRPGRVRPPNPQTGCRIRGTRRWGADSCTPDAKHRRYREPPRSHRGMATGRFVAGLSGGKRRLGMLTASGSLPVPRQYMP